MAVRLSLRLRIRGSRPMTVRFGVRVGGWGCGVMGLSRLTPLPGLLAGRVVAGSATGRVDDSGRSIAFSWEVV